jgi:hypothetical protein
MSAEYFDDDSDAAILQSMTFPFLVHQWVRCYTLHMIDTTLLHTSGIAN